MAFTPLQLVEMYRMEHASRHWSPCLLTKRCVACVRADELLDEHRRTTPRPDSPTSPCGCQYHVVSGRMTLCDKHRIGSWRERR